MWKETKPGTVATLGLDVSVSEEVLSLNTDQEVNSSASLHVGKSELNTHQQIGRLNDGKS